MVVILTLHSLTSAHPPLPQADLTVYRLLGECPELRALTADGDVLLMCEGGVAVRAHRLLLSMASPVLRDILAASAPPPPATARATAAAGRKRQKTAATAASSSSSSAVGSAPLELPCGDDCPGMWTKVLTFLYPVAPSEQRLNWDILGPVLRLADKCAR